MKLVHFSIDGIQKRIGLVQDAIIYDLKDLFLLWSAENDKPMLPIFSFGIFLETTSFSNPRTLQEVMNYKTNCTRYEWSQVKILAPISSSAKILAIGRNYASHAKELGNTAPSEPFYFAKLPSCVIATDETIFLPAESQRVDHEGELAVLIGKKINRMTTREEIPSCIYGYTIVNDVTARDMQKSAAEKGLPWTRAKNYDTFCPLGPVVVTRDSFQPNEKNILVKVNGVVKQNGNTRDLIFDVETLLYFTSRHITLEVGDYLLTGTPEGVSPLQDGDVVTVEIEGIGMLSNHCKLVSGSN